MSDPKNIPLPTENQAAPENGEHSPAPWRLDWKIANGGQHPDFPALHYVGVQSAPGAESVQQELHISGYMRKADAHLIAAAPDLLALAKQYASECSGCDGTGSANRYLDDSGIPSSMVPCEDCADIRAVIAKAEGRS